MSVIGFEEAQHHSLSINLDDFLHFHIASLEGVFLLKLIAWKDRNNRDNKDAEDIGFILANYLNINRNASYTEPYDKVYNDEYFTELKAGAKILGIKLNEILKASFGTKSKIKLLLEEEINKEHASRLFNQIIETNRNLKYDEVAEAIVLIYSEIN